MFVCLVVRCYVPWVSGSPFSFLLRKKGTGSCVPLPLPAHLLLLLHVGCDDGDSCETFLLGSTVLTAYTDEFLRAFAIWTLINGLELRWTWRGVYATSRCGLHCLSIAGPIFVYRVCTHPPGALPPRVQILTHENLSPDQVLSAIAGQFPDPRNTWAEETWHVVTIDSTPEIAV